MMHDDGMDSQTKMQSLMDLIKEMKGLHGEGAKGEPKALEVEIHEMHAMPEDEESPEHEDLESPEEEKQEDSEDPEQMEALSGEESPDEAMEDEDMHQAPMNLHPGLLKLLAEQMKK